MNETEEELELEETEEETKPEEEVEPEEIEKHQKKYPHEYVLRLSEKENETIKELEQKFKADSIKELLFKLAEFFETDKNYPHSYVISFSQEEKKLLEKLQKQYDAKDFRELLVNLYKLTEEKKCPECGYSLMLVHLCLNCAKAYDYSDELEEETEE